MSLFIGPLKVWPLGDRRGNALDFESGTSTISVALETRWSGT